MQVIENVSDYRAIKRFIAEALIKMMNVPNCGRSILLEDAEGWVLCEGSTLEGPLAPPSPMARVRGC